MGQLDHLFDQNRAWADALRARDADFFLKLSRQQSPEYLWIGCSDSRVPANEIVIPTVLMLTVLVGGTPDAGAGAGVMFEMDQAAIGALLRANGWTALTAVNLMLFSLLHNPCSTTIYTIWRETRSAKWTTIATLLPLGMGFVLTFLVAQVWRIATGY